MRKSENVVKRHSDNFQIGISGISAGKGPSWDSGRRIGTMRFYYFNSSHRDRDWYLPFERFRIKLIELVLRILDRLENDPEY